MVRFWLCPEGKSDINWLLHMVTKMRMILSHFFLWLASIIDKEAQDQRWEFNSHVRPMLQPTSRRPLAPLKTHATNNKIKLKKENTRYWS